MRTRATCPFCTSDISPNDFVMCRSCSTPHHHGCWTENGVCTMSGCGSKDAIELVFGNRDDTDTTTTKEISKLLGRCDACHFSLLYGGHTKCTLCGAIFHTACWEDGRNCPACTFGQPIKPASKNIRPIFPCMTCSTDITEGGIRMCAICGAMHHKACWPDEINCTQCNIGRSAD